MSSCETVGVGIIGAGGRGVRCLGTCIAETANETGFRVTALADRNPARLAEAAAYLQAKFGEQQIELAAPALYQDIDALTAAPDVDFVLVTTHSNAHRLAAVPALRSGKKVYVDKPLAHTPEDAARIVEEERRAANPLIMGFTRRYEPPWRKAFELLQEGVIGDLKMMTLRDVIPFWHFFQTWHRRREWSGGALMDKSSHHCDVFNWFAQSRALRVNGFGGRDVFTPDPNAPERCSECDRDCPYRSRKVKKPSQEDVIRLGDSWNDETEEQFRKDNCVYLPGADIYDRAAIHFAYENGVIATLLYCIFAPKADDQETLELIGTEGRIVLTRHTGVINVIGRHGKLRETLDCTHTDFRHSHFGADLELIRETRRFCAGKPPLVGAPQGLEATRMIAAAQLSMDEDGRTVQMQEIPDAE